MDTIETLKKARDEIQALILGQSTKLSNDVTAWVLRDMRESNEYDMPMQLAARDYPAMQYAMRDAKAAFSNFGILPDQETVGGRLFVEKLLTVTLGRLNGMLYTLGEQETPYGDDELIEDEMQAEAKQRRKASPQSDAWLNDIFEKMTGIKGAAALIHAKTGELERRLAARGIHHKGMKTRRKVI